MGILEENKDKLTDIETTEAIIGLGRCNDSTDPTFLNELLNNEVNKLNERSAQLSTDHLINLIQIVPEITHAGALNKEKLLVSAIIALVEQNKDRSFHHLQKSQVLALASSLNKIELSKEDFEKITKNTFRFLISSFHHCL